MNGSTLRRGLVPAAIVLSLSLALAGCSSSDDSSNNANSSISCESGSIKASGSTAQKNAMTEWINAYQGACTGATINYQANGSGAGIADFVKNQTSFAGSDSALKDEDQTAANKRCSTGDAINLPMVGGAIVLAFNVSGVESLTLTPDLIAGIFNNTITTWNDPKIAAENDGVTLPSSSIAQFHRSDASGTTDNFTKYLAAAAGSDWTYGTGKEWKAPGGQGAKGNDGVTAAIKDTANSIGYIELSFAQDAKLGTAKVDNGGGAVEATSETASATIAAAKQTGSGSNIVLSVDYATKQAGQYPIVLVTYEITCQKGLPSDELALTKSFLTYTASDDAQGQLTEIGYVPISGSLLTDVRTAVGSIS
jgi:phosphate transport system substrate-binding protein